MSKRVQIMKVQPINTPRGERYILIDNKLRPIEDVAKYLKFLDITGKSPNTIKSYAQHLKVYCEFLETQGIGIREIFANPRIGPIDLFTLFIEYLQSPSSCRVTSYNGRSDSTINTIVDTVLQFYQYLSKNEDLHELDAYKQQRMNPQFKSFLSELVKNKQKATTSIFHRKEEKKPIKHITREQYTALFKVCTNNRDRLLLALLYEAGLRVSEALGLHIRDVSQLEDGIIRITPRENNENGARVKNKAGGIVKLPPYVVDLLIDYINNDILDYDSDFLFLVLNGPTAGNPLSVSTVEKLFERLSKQVGFHVTPHMLRHGFATEKLEAGWDFIDISKYLRHTSVQSTQIYTHYSDELKLEKMRSFFEQNQISYGGVNINDNNN